MKRRYTTRAANDRNVLTAELNELGQIGWRVIHIEFRMGTTWVAWLEWIDE